MQTIEEKITNIIEKEINNLSYELYDLEYVKQGKDYYLRIYIDSKNGISLDDCEKVSNVISDLLDEKDIIKVQYYLEVSSPGIERILTKEKHFRDNIGQLVEINLYQKQDNQKQFIGNLKDFNDEKVYIEIENETLIFDRKNISQIKTLYNWN